MKKEKSEKLEVWSKKDIALNVFVYVINLIIIMGLFIFSAYINCVMSGGSFVGYIAEVKKPLYLFVMMALLLAVMAMYFFFEDRNFLRKPSNSQMIFLIIEIALIVNYGMGKFVNVYVRPIALVALFTLFLTNRKTSIFMNVIFCLMVLLMDSFTNSGLDASYSSLLIGFTSGVIAVYLVGNAFSRWGVLTRSILISVPAVMYIALAHFEYGLDNFYACMVSGASSGLLTGAFFVVTLPAFENAFSKVSCFKLSEITDHKSSLISKIITEAPGTFNHSIVLSNLAEACALAIGEDSLLARTCAYYHDVGKLRRPEFFMENQTDKVNPHDDLTPELSTNIIRSHAQDGYQLVLKHGLPKEIADVCLEHHGTMPIFYFYDKAKKFTDGEVDIAKYSYYGPKPQTKIAAIIMIADGCEAAVRTIADRSRDNVTKVVRKIVSDRMALGQFDECEITLKELNIIINTVVNSLTGVYHSRVEYPSLTLEGITEESPLVSGETVTKIEPGLIKAEKNAELEGVATAKTATKEKAVEKKGATAKASDKQKVANKPKTSARKPKAQAKTLQETKETLNSQKEEK